MWVMASDAHLFRFAETQADLKSVNKQAKPFGRQLTA